eukprot:12101311-Alexandrium_andersonii.AAC.1
MSGVIALLLDGCHYRNLVVDCLLLGCTLRLQVAGADVYGSVGGVALSMPTGCGSTFQLLVASCR